MDHLFVAEHAFLLHKEYNGYVHQEVHVHSSDARIIRCERAQRDKSDYVIVHVLDRGKVADPAERTLWITIYQRMGEVTPLGPEPGELVGVISIDREPWTFYVFRAASPVDWQAPTRPAPSARTQAASPHPPASSKEEQLFLGETPRPSDPQTSAKAQDDESLW